MGIFFLSFLYDTRNGAYGFTHTHIQRLTHTHYQLILFYLWPGNGSSAMSVELNNTILSHIGLTSNTSDKPILFLSHRVITMSPNHIIVSGNPAETDGERGC